MPQSSRFLRGSVATAALVLAGLSPSRASAQYSGVYFFGDSFTDTGNAVGLSAFASLPNPAPSPPYFAGRFSNGPVWSEMFAARLGLAPFAGPAWLSLGGNYAVGGATTGALGGFGSATGMLAQGQQFATQHPISAGNPTGGVQANSLFVLWGGANDIIAATSLATPLLRQQAVAQSVSNITSLAAFLSSTYSATNFLIPLLPNVGSTPQFLGNPAGAAIASDLTNAFNLLLAQGIAALDAVPNVNAYGLNLNNLLTNIAIDAAAGGSRYGITNTTVPCFTIPNPNGCSNALFVDGLHVTTQVQALVANAAYDRVVFDRDVAVVPEPKTVALTGLGMGVLGVAFRRRRTRQLV